jgi:LPXTG-site transpeptidase (sortase) family protein
MVGIGTYQNSSSSTPVALVVPGATIPAVAPAGIPPVVGDGVLAVVPSSASGAVTPVTADLGGGWRGTLLVQTDRYVNLAVRVQVLDVASQTHVDISPGADSILRLSVQVFDAENGRLLDPFPSPIAFGLRPPVPAEVSSIVMFGLDEGAVQLQPMIAQVNSDTGTLTVQLDRSTRFALGRNLRSARGLATVAPVSLVTESAATSVSGPIGSTTSPTTAGTETARELISDRAPLPVRLRIASIGVDAPIAPVGLEPDGVMAVTDEAHVVGWYELGARPGEVANSVLTGHVDWKQEPAVFFRLRETKPGDIVEVVSGFGGLYRYRIESLQTYRADDAPIADIFGPSSAPILTLITCDGWFDHTRREYQDRLVIRARGV